MGSHRKEVPRSERPTQPSPDDEADKAGSTSQEFGKLSVEDDAEGPVDPADLAGSGGPEDDGGPTSP